MTPSGRNPVGRLLGRLGRGGRVAYECGMCGLTYDSDRLNCPACGGPVEEA